MSEFLFVSFIVLFVMPFIFLIGDYQRMKQIRSWEKEGR